MATLDYESMREDLRRRYDALPYYEQQAVGAVLEVLDCCYLPYPDDPDCAVEAAIEIVESGNYDFYSPEEVESMRDLAYKLVHGLIPSRYECAWDYLDPYTVARLDPYIDYDKLAEDLYIEGYCDTSFGIVIHIYW